MCNVFDTSLFFFSSIPLFFLFLLFCHIHKHSPLCVCFHSRSSSLPPSPSLSRSQPLVVFVQLTLMRPHIPWLLVVLAECLTNAAPIQPNTPTPSLPIMTSFYTSAITPSHTYTRPTISLVPRQDKDAESPTPTLFSHLLNPPPRHTSIDLFPPRPTIPLIFAFHRSRNNNAQNSDSAADQDIPPPASPPQSSPTTRLPPIPVVPVPGAQDADDTKMRQVLADCLAARAPTLPDAFPPEVGVVRLFSQGMYRGETIARSGCGCIDLSKPFPLHSFVGSRNHSFSFFESAGCSGEPYYQRLHQHFDVGGDRTTRSIRITQGILLPISLDST